MQPLNSTQLNSTQEIIIGKKEKIDLFGALSLISVSALLGLNHVVIKVVNTELNPVFFAGLRSFLAFFSSSFTLN